MANPFNYLQPRTLDEAIEMKSSHGTNARFWAGGTDMMLLWKRKKAEFEFCIDLAYVNELRFIEVADETLKIGAMATLDDLDLRSDLGPASAALGATARLMCTKQTRTLATVGGNLCHASPSADLTPPLVAMGALARVRGPKGNRSLPLEDFHLGVNQTALSSDEILVDIAIPDIGGFFAASYKRVARTVVDIALVSSSVCLRVDEEGKIKNAGVALGAVAPSVFRVTKAENTLVGESLASARNGTAAVVGEEAANAAKAITDIRASKEYRTSMTATLTERAVASCVETLKGNG